MIEVPCLLIVGNKDNCIELESIIKSTEYTEKYFLKVIENSGHFPHQEHPETVNQALAKFLLGKQRIFIYQDWPKKCSMRHPTMCHKWAKGDPHLKMLIWGGRVFLPPWFLSS